MTEEDQSDSTLRRTFMKGAAATGVAATGVTAFSGGAAAQQDNIEELVVRNINLQNGVLNVNVQNVNILRDFDDIVVTVIGGDVLSNIDVNIENIDVDVDVNVVDVLNNNVVQVAIVALSETGDIVAQGSGATNDL